MKISTFPFLPAIPSLWTSRQTYQAKDSANTPLLAFKADPSDSTSDQFNFTVRTFPNFGTNNLVTRIGNNIAPNGSPVNAARPAFADEWEQDYNTGSRRVCERHVAAFTAPGRPIQRPITIFLDWQESSPSAAGNSLGFNIEEAFHNAADGTTRLFTSNKASGFRTSNFPIGTQHASVSADHLILSGPAAQSGKFLSFVYNFSEFTSMSAYGELRLTGSGKAGAGSQNSLLTVRGRSGTPHSLQVESSDGAQRLSVDASGTYLIFTAPTVYNRGDLLVQSGTTTRFGIIASSGQIWSNQWSAGGPLGAVNGKYPWYSETGTLRGYVEVRDLA